MLFENKSVLITGGSSGIGRACAIAFASEGAQVLISDVNADGGAETVEIIQDAGGTASYITADVSRPDEVKTMMDAVIDRYGKLDIAINNAGIAGDYVRFTEHPLEEFDKIMSINVRGVFLCMQHEIDLMLQNEAGGAIVNLSSAAGLVAAPKNAPYAASKHAVIGLTKSAAIEFASKKIRVNAVAPSWTNTPMVSNALVDNPRWEEKLPLASPMRRLGSADEIAAAIIWLASDHASFVNGVTLSADGGLTAM